MKINPLDLLAALLILVGLFGVSKNKNFWIVYGCGNILWIYLSLTVGFYCGAVMNVISLFICIKNWRKK